MLKTQKVFWWRTGSANTEGKLGKEPDGEMGSLNATLLHPQKPLEKWMKHCVEMIFCKVMHGYLVLLKLTWVI